MATVNLVQSPHPKDTLIVARQDGRLYLADFREYPHLDFSDAVDWSIAPAKLMVGKVQHTRTRLQTLQQIEVENVVDTEVQNPELTIFGTLDGKTPAFQTPVSLPEESDGYLTGNCRVTAKNFEVMLTGVYNVNTMVLTYNIHGRR